MSTSSNVSRFIITAPMYRFPGMFNPPSRAVTLVSAIFQALGNVLRVFGIELPVHHARGVGPFVVQDYFQAVLPGLLQGRPVELEVVVAQGRPCPSLDGLRPVAFR